MRYISHYTLSMQQLLRTAKFASTVPSVLVTAQEVIVPRIYERFNVTQFQENKTMPRDLLLKEIPNHDAVYCLLRDKIDKEFLNHAKKLKLVASMSVGFDHIDVKECKKRGITVTNTPEVLTETTAETAVTLLLVTARRIPEGIHQAKSGGWGTWSPFYMCGDGIRNSTIGMIGLGRVGGSVVTKLKSFLPQRIIFTDIKPDLHRAEQLGIEYVSFDNLLASSDFVILTCAATPENKNLMNKTAFQKMKKNATLINIARGTLVNQDDLVDALKNGTIKAAGLDVTVPEPLPLDHPLFKLDNCVILPHMGSATVATRKDMMALAEDAIVQYFSGGKINPKTLVV
uniref:Glyoxylate reductase/hydroxypyruvate reductase n=2 Tax=Parascaris univalens TaxID=6257 RepID=A0A914ZHA5_PARUN